MLFHHQHRIRPLRGPEEPFEYRPRDRPGLILVPTIDPVHRATCGFVMPHVGTVQNAGQAPSWLMAAPESDHRLGTENAGFGLLAFWAAVL
jgi:hypothetical protein